MYDARAYAFLLSILGSILRTSLLTPSTCPSCLYAPEGSTEEATEVQDAGCMRQHAAKNSAAWQCRECLESFVRVWTDCPSRDAMSIAEGTIENRVASRMRNTRQARHVPSVRTWKTESIRLHFYRLLAFVIGVVGLSNEKKNAGINIWINT